MTKIAIITAMEEELEAVKAKMEIHVKKQIHEITIYDGTIKKIPCILTRCGVGKVNAARVAQIIIDQEKVDTIINVGSAGAINDELKIGDIIIAEKLLQHDFDITAFGHPKGYISEIGTYFETNPEILRRCERILAKNPTIKKGIIATGDIFCTSIQTKKAIRKEFKADCVEMEGAAIAQVCMLDHINCLVIRAISDTPNEDNAVDFNTFINYASKKVADVIEDVMK